jgi:hypothetical protein
MVSWTSIKSILPLLVAMASRSCATGPSITFSGSLRSTNMHDYDATFRFDLATKSSTQLNTTGERPPGTSDFLSSAAVCGTPRTRFAIWTDFSKAAWGITSTNLETGVQSTSETPVLYHGIWCQEGAGPQKLIAVGSEAAADGAKFTVRLYNSDAPMDDTKLADINFKGMLWSGQDTLFSYSAETQQFWAALPTNSQVVKTGKVVVVDLRNGNATGTSVYELPLGGWPFLVYAGKQGRIALHSKGKFAGNVEDLEWAEITLPSGGGKAAITRTKAEVFPALGRPEGPAPNCNGTIYAFSNDNAAQVLHAVNADTGDTLWSQDFSTLSQKYALSAIGCE